MATVRTEQNQYTTETTVEMESTQGNDSQRNTLSNLCPTSHFAQHGQASPQQN